MSRWSHYTLFPLAIAASACGAEEVQSSFAAGDEVVCVSHPLGESAPVGSSCSADRTTRFTPYSWPFTTSRLSSTAGFVVPAITTFADRIEGLEGPGPRTSWRETMLGNFDIDAYRELNTRPKGFFCVSASAGVADPSQIRDNFEAGQFYDAAPLSDATPTTIADYVHGYQEWAAGGMGFSPTELAEMWATRIANDLNNAFIDFDPTLFVQQMAESEARYLAGTARVLEGVPIAVKGQIDVQGYPTSVGTRWRQNSHVAAEDADVVRNLRALGAVPMGNTNAHELVAGVTGINPHFGAVKNARNQRRVGGGSSGGAAVAVARAFAPVAIGSDAGGSIRIPASFNGLYGLKPTFGRMSMAGAYPVGPTLSQVGPIATNAADLAAVYLAMGGGAGIDELAAGTTLQTLGQAGALRVGVPTSWTSAASAPVQAVFNRAVSRMETYGSQTSVIDVPPFLEWVNRAQILLFANSVSDVVRADPFFRLGLTSPEARIVLSMGALATVNGLSTDLGPRDIEIARGIQSELHASLNQLFACGVDVIAVPTTGIVAPLIRQDAIGSGESDIKQLDQVAQFTNLANMSGHPAITIPIGITGEGLPVGLQLIGRGYSESTLLQIAHIYEQLTMAQ